MALSRAVGGRVTRIVVGAGLALVLGVTAFGISQCRLSPDAADRAALETGAGRGLGPCISACAHRANELIRAESELHVGNVHACGGDPACLAQEEIRHIAAVARIQAGRDSCFQRCHHQGRGGGR